ncbi:hypothetical protein ACS0TY_016875 [Phlomoides rotata]
MPDPEITTSLIAICFNHNEVVPLNDHHTDDAYGRSEAIMCANSLVSPTIFEGGF